MKDELTRLLEQFMRNWCLDVHPDNYVYAIDNFRSLLAEHRLAVVELGDGRHIVELRDDGWTIQHPVGERIDGSLFDCKVGWKLGAPNVTGRFYLNDDGSLGEKI